MINNILVAGVIVLFLSSCTAQSSRLYTVKAEACVPTRPMLFDKFMDQSLSASIPLTVLVPSEFEHVEQNRAPITYSYWMTSEMGAVAKKTGIIPTPAGFMYGKVSSNVGYDANKDIFIGAEDIEKQAREAGFTNINVQRASSKGYALLFLEATDSRSDKNIYSVYVAMNVSTNVVFIAYRPPNNDRKIGDCFWAAFKDTLLESNQK